MIQIVLLVFVGLVALVIAMLAIRFKMDARDPYEVPLGDTWLPEFERKEISFDHQHDNKTTLPFMAGAVIDINGSGRECVFLGGGRSQPDGLFYYDGESFVPVHNHGIDKADGEATMGANVLDTNGDGLDDLILVRTDGIWLFANKSGRFEGKKLNATMPADTTPLSVTVADLTGNGHFDMYVSGYIRNDLVKGQNIFNKPGYGGTSQLFLNNGDDTFTNATKESGLEYEHNTFVAVFADVNENGLMDLVVAHDTGHICTWRNLGDGKFEPVTNPNSEEYSYPMGIAVGDYNNDGRVDFFFSNVGSTVPNFMVRGDLREDQKSNWKWLLFRNDGDFAFTDTADETKLANFEFGWGAVFADFNLNGREDLVVSENFINLPPHKVPALRLPGRLLLQTQNGEFASVGEKAGVVNKRFSIAPLVGDFNGNGRPDIVHVNLGGRSVAFLNKAGKGNSLKVKLPNTVAFSGAKVTVMDSGGRNQSKWLVHGEGMSSESSPVLIFGLAENTAASIQIKRVGEDVESFSGPFESGTFDLLKSRA